LKDFLDCAFLRQVDRVIGEGRYYGEETGAEYGEGQGANDHAEGPLPVQSGEAESLHTSKIPKCSSVNAR
jgi:hypothetical protein